MALNKELMPIFMQGWVDQRSGYLLEDCEFGEKTIGRKLWISGYEASKANPVISYTEYINSIQDDYDQQEFEDETRRAIDMAGGCSRCGDLDGYTCICDDDLF